jgi:hypothetical protein
VCWRRGAGLPGPAKEAGQVREPSNKRMKLTRLVAAPGRQDKVPPRAPAGRTGRTASQLMRRVRRT